jgi:DNA-directed RNA polymerase subunit RPC12/RpoP
VTAEQKGKDVQCPHCGRRFPALAADRASQRTPRESPPGTFPRSTPPAATSDVIRFSCPQCERVLEVPSDQAGVKLPCPSCGQRLKAPLPIDKTVYGKRLDTPALQRPLSGLEPALLPASSPTPSSMASPKEEGTEEAVRQLVVLVGPDKGKVFSLPETGTVRIGRAATAEVRLVDIRVSRGHCELHVSVDQVVLAAPESQRAVFVNDVRITTDRLLQPGDVLRVGESELRFDVPDVSALKTVYGDVHEVLRQIAGEGKLAVTCACGQELVARAKYAGTRVRCPACEEFVTLPGKGPRGPHGELTQTLPSNGAETTLGANAIPPAPRSNRLVVAALALCLIALLAALGTLYWAKSFP